MIPLSSKIQLSAVTAGLFLIAGCAMSGRAPSRRQQLISLLEREMQNNTGWIQVHAADALLDHGETKSVAAFFAAMAGNPPPAYRIGVWRVMARAGQTEETRRAAAKHIQKVLGDPQATDRLQAAESLAKLGLADSADRTEAQSWLAKADEPVAPFLRWLWAVSEKGQDRAANETALAALFDATDPVTRLRAAVALGRLGSLPHPVLQRLRDQLLVEADGSIGKVYVIAANLRQAGDDAELRRDLKRQLQSYLTAGKPNEQLEAATVLGLCGAASDRAALDGLLKSPEADARIGAASGLLYLLK